MIVATRDCFKTGRCRIAFRCVGFAVVDEGVPYPSRAKLRKQHALTEIEQLPGVDAPFLERRSEFRFQVVLGGHCRRTDVVTRSQH